MQRRDTLWLSAPLKAPSTFFAPGIVAHDPRNKVPNARPREIRIIPRVQTCKGPQKQHHPTHRNRPRKKPRCKSPIFRGNSRPGPALGYRDERIETGSVASLSCSVPALGYRDERIETRSRLIRTLRRRSSQRWVTTTSRLRQRARCDPLGYGRWRRENHGTGASAARASLKAIGRLSC
jgi:hypothetical protein